MWPFFSLLRTSVLKFFFGAGDRLATSRWPTVSSRPSSRKTYPTWSRYRLEGLPTSFLHCSHPGFFLASFVIHLSQGTFWSAQFVSMLIIFISRACCKPAFRHSKRQVMCLQNCSCFESASCPALNESMKQRCLEYLFLFSWSQWFPYD